VSQAPPGPTDSPVHPPDDRLGLARFRTQLALDRTTLAWVRTALSMASFGFGMVAFFRTLQEHYPGAEARRLHQGAVQFGVALIVLGLVATALAGLSHWLALRRLRRGVGPGAGQWPLSVTVALLFAILCLAGLWALFER
jgi:putative membrane protein